MQLPPVQLVVGFEPVASSTANQLEQLVVSQLSPEHVDVQSEDWSPVCLQLPASQSKRQVALPLHSWVHPPPDTLQVDRHVLPDSHS